MNEVFESKPKVSQVTPRDFARAVLRSKDLEMPEPNKPQAGDRINRDGEEMIFVPKLRWTKQVKDGAYVDAQVPYTYKQYYSHSFEDPATSLWEPAQGHDSKHRLLDDAMAQHMHGRSFTREQLRDLPNNLPDDEVLFARSIDSDDATEYQEYVEQQNS